MNCPICNAENAEGSKFCLKCGAPLTGGFGTVESNVIKENSQPIEYNPLNMIMPENNTEPQEFNPVKAVTPQNNFEPQEINPVKAVTPEENLEPQEFKPVIQKEEKIKKTKEQKEPKEPRKPRKGLKVTLIVIAAIVVLVGGFRLIFPREFYQLILSDSKYNQYLLAKEAMGVKNTVTDAVEDRMTSNEAYSFESGMNVELGDSLTALLPAESADFSASLVDYLNSVKLKGESTSDGLKSKEKIEIADNDGTLLTFYSVQDGSVGYFKADEISDKWFKLSPDGVEVNDLTKLLEEYQKMNKEENQLKGSATELAKTFLSVYDTADIDITGGQTLTIGSQSVKGDKSSVKITAAQLIKILDKTEKQAKNDTELYNALKAYYDKTIETSDAFKQMADDSDFKFDKNTYVKYVEEYFGDVKDEIKSSELKTLTIDQYINRKNEVVGVQIKFDYKSDSPETISYLNNKKERKPQMALEIRPTDKNEAKDFDILAQLEGEDKENGKASFEFNIDGDSGKVNVVYKDFKEEDDFATGQVDVTFSGFESFGGSVLKDSKISYKSYMQDKAQKSKFTLDVGDYGKIALNSTRKTEEAKNIESINNAVNLYNSNGNMSSKASEELYSGFMNFYASTFENHSDLASLVQEGYGMFASSILGGSSDESGSDAYTDNYSDTADDSSDYSDYFSDVSYNPYNDYAEYLAG